LGVGDGVDERALKPACDITQPHPVMYTKGT
jgi:hypothetical protein